MWGILTMYKYYMIGKMADADFLPSSGLISVKLYGSKPFFSSIGCRVCGEVIYSRKLCEKEITRCHLSMVPGIMG